MPTQEERRTATIEKVLAGTIQCLAERGYAGTTTAAICKRARVSQGGMFRHFPTRLDVIVAATERIGDQHVVTIHQLENAGVCPRTFVELARSVTRSAPHAAWHEVMVAARTDEPLRNAVIPVLRRFEAALQELARSLVPDGHPDPEAVERVVLSILRLFDSESVTRQVYCSPDVEAARFEWAVHAVEQVLSGASRA